MSDISTLKEKIDTNTFYLVLLTIVTAGAYMYIWLYKASTAIEEVTHIKVMSKGFLIGYLITVTWVYVAALFISLLIPGLSLLWAVTVWLLAVVWCFRVRRALRIYTMTKHGFEPRINRAFSVLFTFYHINYCINALARDKNKNERKKPLIDSSVEA
ncbi:hypothetical protein M5G20_25115 [Pseudomonas sp. TNT2022 ID1044]|uniref:hypothetical protein n=1 Tax=Pseudomonas sp. TNT2022 ID1044 TaxID=2942636 RepID=UPI00235F57F4|nr:hypothetical protein [Pseudomonas sp. TNT2022 ID1044]MDD0999127.1 hypothetical protein [Pseudomonas sp. TNT2022 ID1044]